VLTPEPIADAYCATCRLFHAAEMACAVARAVVHAEIVDVGDVVDEEEIADCDRVALLAALRIRGISLEEFPGPQWLAVRTVAA
jgi:hypothetical protein